VLRVDQVYVIRHKRLVEGVAVRRIAREMGISRNTVRKYVGQAEPVRQVRQRRGRPVFERVGPRLEQLVDEWTPRTTPKQRLTAARLHRQLSEEGEAVGLTLVQDWLRERRRRVAEVYVPLVHRPGDEAQVDFFDVTVEIGSEWRKAWLFVMRLMYSGRDFAWVYEWADQVSFLDGHVRAFAAFGAVPHRCIYDNLSAAVRRLVLPERELTARFQGLASHYLFEPCFTRPGTGHDKGGVEGRGKGIRLQEFTPIPRAASLAMINAQLGERLATVAATRRREDGHTIQERYEAERADLLPLPATAYEPRKVVPCSVSRRALVRVEGVVYSVPCQWKLLEATAYVGAADVRLVCRGEALVVERERFGGKRIRYRHYLPELARKPQAVRQVAAELLAELGEPFGALWRLLVDTHGPHDAARTFARVLSTVLEHGEAAVARAVTAALAANRTDLLALVEHLQQPLPRPVVPVPATLAAYEVEAASAATYDALWHREVGDE
jgi:transposase